VCSHEPQCPSAGDTARAAAHIIAGHPEQGWSLLCNGIVLFDDGGLLLPGGRAHGAVLLRAWPDRATRADAARMALPGEATARQWRVPLEGVDNYCRRKE